MLLHMCFERIDRISESTNANTVDFLPWNQHVNSFGSVNFCWQSAWLTVCRACVLSASQKLQLTEGREKWGGRREVESVDGPA